MSDFDSKLSEQRRKRFVVTGASRGLGLEMCRQLLSVGHEVFALARNPADSAGLMELAEKAEGRLLHHPVDVENSYSVQPAAAAVDAAWDHVDVLVNNAGVAGRVEARLSAVEIEDIRSVFEVNLLGVVRVTQAFLPALQRSLDSGSGGGVLHITSLMGSMTDNESGGYYPYRISKAALNMLHKNLSCEFADSGLWSIAMHPGWVQTDMGGGGAPLTADEAVRSMVATMLELRAVDNGRFVDRDGADLPW